MTPDAVSAFPERYPYYRIFLVRLTHSAADLGFIAPVYIRHQTDDGGSDCDDIARQLSDRVMEVLNRPAASVEMISSGDMSGANALFPPAIEQFAELLAHRLAKIATSNTGGFFQGIETGQALALIDHLQRRNRTIWYNIQTRDFDLAQLKQSDVPRGFIYVLSQNHQRELVKIGYSLEPNRRLLELKKALVRLFSFDTLPHPRRLVRDGNGMLAPDLKREQAQVEKLRGKLEKGLIVKMPLVREVDQPFKVERHIHDELAHHRYISGGSLQASGEWFRLEPEAAVEAVNRIIDAILVPPAAS